MSSVRAGASGRAVSARLAERALGLSDGEPDVVLLCVPDRAIASVAAAIEPGPWLAHVSGGTPLTALAPHERRFSLHPLQTFTHDRGPEQLDGAWAAVTGESDQALAVARSLAEVLGLRPVVLSDEHRALYHAGAAVASNYLVTLRRAAGELLPPADVPPESLDPLMRRVIENGFQLTGPIERGDWETVERHREAIAEQAPGLLEAVRRAGASDASRDRGRGAGVIVARNVADVRAALADRRDGRIGLVPTMGALHAGHDALLAAGRDDSDTVVMSLFVDPAQFGDPADLNGYPRDEASDVERARAAGVDVAFAPSAAELYPPGYQTWST